MYSVAFLNLDKLTVNGESGDLGRGGNFPPSLPTYPYNTYLPLPSSYTLTHQAMVTSNPPEAATTLSPQQQQLQLLQKALDGPAIVPPPGVKPNFFNPPNLEKEFYVDLILCLTISVLVVCMRMWTKARLVRKVQIEDWVCVLALAGFAGYCAEIFYTMHVGYTGVHQYNLQLKNFSKKLYHIRIELTTFGFIIFTVKLAILLQYLRVFCPPGIRDAIFWICHTLIWLNFIFYAVSVFLIIFICNPIEKFWKPWIKGGRCLDINAINLGAAFLNSASDISILIVPQHVIWKLQLSRAKKIGMSAVFLTGVLACVSSLIRVYYTFKLVKTKDVNYYISVLGLWTLPEITSAFLAICLPLAPKFFTSFRPPPLRRSSGYQRHDHPINNNLPDSHRAAVAATAAAAASAVAGGQRSAKKSWTSTGKTAVNTESSEFELADTEHIVQRADISTKFENKD